MIDFDEYLLVALLRSGRRSRVIGKFRGAFVLINEQVGRRNDEDRENHGDDQAADDGARKRSVSFAAGPSFSANGINPMIVASDVIRIGRRRMRQD